MLPIFNGILGLGQSTVAHDFPQQFDGGDFETWLNVANKVQVSGSLHPVSQSDQSI